MGKVTYPALTSLLCILKELVRKKLLDAPSLLRVLDEALLNEVRECRTPFVWNALDRVVDYRIEQVFQVFGAIVERRITLSQLKGEATVRPYVNFGRVGVALGDFGRNPTRCALLSLAILLLLGKEHAETHICNFDIAVGSTKDIVRFDIPVQNVFRMHGLKAQCYLIETELAEIFRKVASSINDDICEIASFHQLDENPKTILEVIDLFTFDELVTVEE